MKLNKDFYTQNDVRMVAKQLLGKEIFVKKQNALVSAFIVETEAYEGITDKASHAYGGKRTKRTEIMYAEGGCAYVYLCYGMHYLFNVVSNKVDIPHAVLIRAVIPNLGFDENVRYKAKFADGPAKLTKLMNIDKSLNGISLLESQIWIEDRNIKVFENDIIKSKRIGIDYAKEDSELLYRYQIEFELIKKQIII